MNRQTAGFLQSLTLMRLATPTEIPAAIAIARLIASEGLLLLPLGVIADWAAIFLGTHSVLKKATHSLRNYDDHVLGRMLMDRTIDRASIAIRRYAIEDRPRGVAFAIGRIVERFELPGFEISSSELKELASESPEILVQRAVEDVSGQEKEIYDTLVRAFRRAPEILSIPDAIALEHRTALGGLAQRIAHRQVLEQAALLEQSLPRRRPNLQSREVPTNITDEDQYPVGGYASIGTRGSIESLLLSQLAYMDERDSPDLFDARFVRDELFYYTRDENQHYLQRRSFAFHFSGDLVQARVKDTAAPVQRIVLAMALVLTTIRTLTDWLGHEAARFSVSFNEELEAERKLFEILLRDHREVTFAHEKDAFTLCATPCEAASQLVVAELPALILEHQSVELKGEAWPTSLNELLNFLRT